MLLFTLTHFRLSSTEVSNVTETLLFSLPGAGIACVIVYGIAAPSFCNGISLPREYCLGSEDIVSPRLVSTVRSTNTRTRLRSAPVVAASELGDCVVRGICLYSMTLDCCGGDESPATALRCD